jgi:glucose-6-phosphate 1-dehydrogenase
MSGPPREAEALVLYGVTGDLAYRKIFPALLRMVIDGTLDVPVIGVSRRGWTLDQLRGHARASIEAHGGNVPAPGGAVDRLLGLLHYVDGDYASAATFDAVARELEPTRLALHYLAIPPALFEGVVSEIARIS